MSPDIQKLISVPDFERRCDAFVEEVENFLRENYSNLDYFDAKNSTMLELREPDFFAKKAQKMAEELIVEMQGPRALEQVKAWKTRRSDRADVDSATLNDAMVSAFFLDEKPKLSEFKKIVKEIDQIAQKYGGIKGEEYVDAEKTEDPNVVATNLMMFYMFR